MEKKDTFLESKIQTPTASRSFLVRERLIRRLSGGEERLVVVSAGMGFGKTVLLTHFAKRYPEKCAWYHLGDSDNDIMAFSRYLAQSVAKVAPDFSLDYSPYLALEQNEAMVRNLALDFAVALGALGERELCLILDDFQVISSDWVFDFLQILWQNAPAGLRLYIVTKSTVPQFCARYLMEGSAAVLGADSLAFNLEEIEELVRDYAVPDQLEGVARAIQTHMEGWPAGVTFTILYFRQRQLRMVERDIEQASQQSYLQSYFMHELFRKLPFDLQHFLTYTSVLDYLSPDVCNALTGIENSASQLSYLEQENLFIYRLSGGGRIYRYHSLFRSFLSGLLQGGVRRELLEAAADFYLHTPDKAQAVEYAIACGDGERIQSALESAGPEMLARGQLDTLARWLEELRRTGEPPTPETLLLQGQYAERMGDWRAALDRVEEVVEQFPKRTGERCYLEARLLRARIAREQLSASKSLQLLDEFMDRLRPDRTALQSLRRQAVELRVRNLLDLDRSREGLELALSEMEGAARRQDPSALAWSRELAVVCYFTMGEYVKAVQTYLVLRGSGGGGEGVASKYQALYLAMSGRARRGQDQLRRELEELREDVPRYLLENLLLIHGLVERMAELEGETPASKDQEGKNLWEAMSISGGGFGQSGGSPAALLRRAFQEEGLADREEEAVFRLRDGRLRVLQDGARWLCVRRLRRQGRGKRALELYRLACAEPEEAVPEGAVYRERSGFGAFLDLEAALLLRGEDRAAALTLLGRCAPYLRENRLVCPGLTQEESTALEGLLAELGGGPALPAPPEEGAEPLPRRVEVRCFGKFRVLLPDGEELRWRTRKAEELFAYLFHLQGKVVDREKLMDILWPQASPTSATSLLHTSLYSIRKVLVPFGLEGLILRRNKGYGLDMDLTVSGLPGMEALCQAERRGETPPPEGVDLLALYQGPYLEDLEAPWAEDSRAYYAGGFLRLCRGRARELMDRGAWREAIPFLRAATRQEPYDEDLAALLIQCYSAAGEVKNAMQQYNRLKQSLETDLGAGPGEALTRVYKECLSQRLWEGRTAT